jgi:hypothetical protein
VLEDYIVLVRTSLKQVSTWREYTVTICIIKYEGVEMMEVKERPKW